MPDAYLNFGMSIVFAGHDPGAKNLLRPLFQRAQREGYSAVWVDLCENPTGWSLEGAVAVVAGCSTNQAEMTVLRAARMKEGVASMQITDLLYRSEVLGCREVPS